MYLLVSMPGLLHVLLARARCSPSGLTRKSKPGPFVAARLLEAGDPGREEVRGDVADVGPPRVWRSAVRSITAMIARRTFTLSSGLTVVFSEM